jgi:hypothetical protein
MKYVIYEDPINPKRDGEPLDGPFKLGRKHL